jgi:hypothetical protein
MAKRVISAVIETSSEHIDGIGEVFTARVVRGAPKRWHGMSITARDLYRSFAYVDLCDMISRRYRKVRFDFTHEHAV